ncbi:MAG: DEAD/DEAH box helicase [Chloroflexi bacterium]|nr:DEAD/DEAH box helicase [Chloroflexota bacterium]
MLIDINAKNIFIREIDAELKPRYRSQLDFWGFIWDQERNYYWMDTRNDKLFQKIINYFDTNNIQYSLSKSSRLLIEEIHGKKIKFEDLINLVKKYQDGNYKKEEYKTHLKFIYENIERRLKDHQIKASFHLNLIGNGANFSVPGSGKTTVVLTAFEKLRQLGKVNILFVVGPPSCFGPWKEEYEAVFGRRPRSIILAGGNKLIRKSEYFQNKDIYDLYLTTFQTLLNDQDEVRKFLRSKKISAYLVIDEAHYIKKIDGNWAKAILNIGEFAKFRCILTGTPIPNSYSDLYNMFDFLWPHNEIISNEDKLRIQIEEDQSNIESASRILEPIVGPFFYRVRKSELGLMPQIFHEPYLIQMNHNERILYDAVENKIRNYSKEDYLKNIEMVLRLQKGRMVRLRQCLSYPKLLATAIDDYEENLFEHKSDLRSIISKYDSLERPEKLNYLIKLINNFQGKKEKVVVWSQFIGTIGLIEKSLFDEGYLCKKIIGDTPIERVSLVEAETREQIVKEFVSETDQLQILIANPAACGESISLHKNCSNAVYYDLSFNGAQYLQSLDRIHRVGGSENKEAHYHFLQYDQTIEYRILNSLKAKARKMYGIVENDYNIYSLDMIDDQDEIQGYEELFLLDEKHI